MSRFFDLVSRQVREIGGYAPAPAAKPANGQRQLIRLDSNENPFGPSPKAVEAMRAALASTAAYPEDDCTLLRQKLAELHELPADHVLVTPGSTGMLTLLCQTLLGPGLNAVTSERSFIVYAMATHAAGAQLVTVPMREDAPDLDAIMQAINEDTRVVFVANPNNPTGTLLDALAIERFLSEVPGHVVLVLDEAYHEFAVDFAVRRKVEYSRSLQYVKQGASVVVLRTFSKVHGLAGLRVGYGLGPAELLGYCTRMRSTFSVSSIAQAAAVAAIEDRAHIAHTVANNSEQAQILGVGLSEMGFRVVPTWANFLYFDLGRDAVEVAERLRSEGISVRPLGAWGAPNCLRVTIGTAVQNRAFLGAMQEISRSASVSG
ncbi:MAG TPA: histidinol-phosphate transaminase [Candidatus Sulfotelmatobacter sp.]|nr:histidinol-phosphate transaminase [Candidatus Sulfotelmatobacter sp.]